jgi:hypothetical protein
VARKLEIEIIGNERDAVRALGSVHHHAGRLGGVLKGTVVAGAAAAGAALAGLGVAAKVGFDEFSEGQKVAAQTNAVIKSTGGVANVTAAHVDALGLSLLRKSGIDDEVIKSSENMLLTFRGVRNEAGAGNDVFDQATKAALDMSVAMGTDATKSALTLGKALNDPATGLTKLTKQGVTFTEAQKEQIESLEASGHTMEAQKIILGELTKEFGGSAEAAGSTFSGQINVAKETLKNLAGDIVGRAMPAVTGLLQRFTDALPAIEAFVGKIADKVGPVLAGVAAQVEASWPQIKATIQSAFSIVETYVLPVLKSLWNILVTTFQNIARVLNDHRAQLETLGQNVGVIFRGIAAVVLPILRVVFEEVLPRAIGVAIGAVTLLSTIVIAVVRAIGATLTALGTAFGAVKDTITAALDLVKTAFRSVQTVGEAAWSGLKRAVGLAIGGILGGIDSFLGGLQSLFEGASHIPFVGDKFKGIANQIQGARDKVQGLHAEMDKIAGKKIKTAVDVNIQFMTRGGADLGHPPAGRGGEGLVGAIGSGAADTARGMPESYWRELFPDLFQDALAANPGGLNPRILDELKIAQDMGLHLISGYRPGAITSSGNVSLHASGRAIDVGPPGDTAAAFARRVAGRPMLAEVIYSPIGWWHAGEGWGPITDSQIKADHYSHVHVGTYDQGGVLLPGLTLAANLTGKPEMVLPPGGGGTVGEFPDGVSIATAIRQRAIPPVGSALGRLQDAVVKRLDTIIELLTKIADSVMVGGGGVGDTAASAASAASETASVGAALVSGLTTTFGPHGDITASLASTVSSFALLGTRFATSLDTERGGGSPQTPHGQVLPGDYMGAQADRIVAGVSQAVESLASRFEGSFTADFAKLVGAINQHVDVKVSLNGQEVAAALGSTGIHFPGFASGAIVKGGQGGTVAWVGEGRHDELVTPLTGGGGLGGEVHYHFEFPNYVGSKDELVRTVRDGFRDWERGGGKLFLR